MIKDLYDSFRDNISQKASNPLLAIIIFVWTFKNWRLIYALFNFDEDQNLESRLNYIENYYIEVDFYENLVISVGYAFLVLIGTYILLVISRSIVNIYENRVLPQVSKLTAPKSIISKANYDILEAENIKLEAKLTEERKNRIAAQNETESHERRVEEYTYQVIELKKGLADYENLKDKFETFKAENESLRSTKEQFISLGERFEKLKKAYDNLRQEQQNSILDKEAHSMLRSRFEILERENDNLKTKNDDLIKAVSDLSNNKSTNESGYPEYFNDSTIRAIQKIENLSFAYELITIGAQILNNEPIKKVDKNTRYLSSLGLIVPSSGYEHNNDYAYYDLTDKGKNVFEYFNELKQF